MTNSVNINDVDVVSVFLFSSVELRLFYCLNVHYHGGSICPAALQPNLHFMVYCSLKGNKINSD